MICVIQFSLQGKQKCIDFFLLLLLHAVSSLHPVCSVHNSDLLIPFVIDFECLYLDRRSFWMKSGRMRSGTKTKKKLVGPDPGQNFAFCLGTDRVRTKFRFLFRACAGPGTKFLCLFGAGPGQSEIATIVGRARARKIRPVQTSSRGFLYNGLSSSLLMCEGFSNFGGGGGGH